MNSRADAWALLTEFTHSQPLRRHALAVEATMRHLARTSGVTDAADIETFGLETSDVDICQGVVIFYEKNTLWVLGGVFGIGGW